MLLDQALLDKVSAEAKESPRRWHQLTQCVRPLISGRKHPEKLPCLQSRELSVLHLIYS